MSDRKKNENETRQKQPKILEIRLIRRQQVRQGLVVASVLALLISSCSKKFSQPNSTSKSTTNREEKVEAVFYENVAQCEADIKKQQEAYKVKLEAYQNQKISQYPVAPEIKPEDCEAQMLAARQQYEKNAPVYKSIVDCQAEGVRCENTPSGYHTSGYRPVFGGSYFYPYGGYRRYTYVNWGGTNRRVYEPRTVYQSSSPGQVVTPNGSTVNRTSPGRTQVPRHTTTPAPKRPSGNAARGTIKGRGSKGFGSTYKGTGRGGK